MVYVTTICLQASDRWLAAAFQLGQLINTPEMPVVSSVIKSNSDVQARHQSEDSIPQQQQESVSGS